MITRYVVCRIKSALLGEIELELQRVAPLGLMYDIQRCVYVPLRHAMNQMGDTAIDHAIHQDCIPTHWDDWIETEALTPRKHHV